MKNYCYSSINLNKTKTVVLNKYKTIFGLLVDETVKSTTCAGSWYCDIKIKGFGILNMIFIISFYLETIPKKVIRLFRDTVPFHIGM